MAKERARHTKPNVWDEAYKLKVYRGGELLDRGVNFFVLMLDQLGFQTSYSCEGHPGGFYITFHAPYEGALQVKRRGYFSVEIEEEGYWSIRHEEHQGSNKTDAMRWAAGAWENGFGPLDFSGITLET